LLAGLKETVLKVTGALDAYELGVASDTLLDFVWYQYCDWYIEASKVQTPTRAAVLSYALSVLVRLLHPISPFITEEIWQALPHDGKTIVTASWPDPEEIPSDRVAYDRFERLKAVVAKVRDLRASLGLTPREKMVIDVPVDLDAEARALLASLAHATLEGTLRASPSEDPLLAAAPRAPAALLRERYGKDIVRLDGEIERLEKMLGNAQFTSKASPEAVAKNREKLAAYGSERERVRAGLVALGSEEGR
jgi:valyl-tRNA synthetase